jgi:hypothetical protein
MPDTIEVRASAETQLDDVDLVAVERMVEHWVDAAPMFAEVRRRTNLTLTQAMLLFLCVAAADDDGLEPWQSV